MKIIFSCAIAVLFCLPVFADQTISIVATNGGKTFDGVGGVSGGGATSVLLKDYVEPQRSQILDFLFKPKFGAAMSALFVEIPGDGNSTQGSELSHAHVRGDENYFRGYEWWLMREAKNRNPAITLDGVAWGCPHWVGNNNFWSQDMCDYYAQWIQGLQHEHGLTFDAIGCRNEKGVNENFAKKLRATLDRAGLEKVRLHGFDNWGKDKWNWTKNLTNDAELRKALDIISNHTMSEVGTPDAVKVMADEMHKPIWNSEEHVYKKGFDCEISLVQVFNQNFISNGVTKILCWYLEASTYPIEPFFDVTTLAAATPWSGEYKIHPALWAYAHYGQFVAVGWKYVDGACGNLNDGGSFVTLASGKDFSTILETKGSAVNQTIAFQVSGGLAAGKICVWRSNEKEQFVKLDDLTPVNGSFSLTLEPNSIYSLSTTSGQQKGSFAEQPAAKNFPFPYHENFDHYADAKSFGYLPHYTADISGGFEIADRPDGNGKCLRQVVAEKAQSWAPEWMPYTIIGDEHWTDYEVSADVNLEHGGWAGLLGRVSNTGGGYGCNPKGYYVRLDADGTCSLWLSTQTKNGAPGNQLATASVGEIGTNTWHNVKLQLSGTNLTAFVDGKQILSVGDRTYASGMAGLVTGGEGNARNTALFDDLIINSVNGVKPEPTVFPQDAAPMYAAIQAASKTPKEIVAAHADDFNSGSPEAKNIWDGLVAAVNANDSATTQTVLEQLKNADGLSPNQLTAITELEAALKKTTAKPAVNTALIPTPRDFPTNWISRHEGYVADAKKGGIDLLFIGDSITDGWRWGNGGSKIWAETFAPRRAANFGIGYDRIQNVLWRIENGELENIAPKVVVLLIGTNNSGNEDDGSPRNSTPEIIAGISNLVRRIQFHLPATKIILFGIFPRGQKNDPIRDQVKTVNAGISQLADDKIKFLDLGEKFLAPDGTLPREMFPDLLHPNEKGYQIWADVLVPALDGFLK